MNNRFLLPVSFFILLALAACAPAAATPSNQGAPQDSGAPAAESPILNEAPASTVTPFQAPMLAATSVPPAAGYEKEAGKPSNQEALPATAQAVQESSAGQILSQSILSPSPPLRSTLPAAPENRLTPVSATVENRLVELEWPAEMRLGDSDIIRLALVPYQEGYLVQAEFPEHQIHSQALQVVQLEGYTLTAIARLDGVNFEIQPAGDQRQYLLAGQTQTWRWTLRPRAPGQQRLAVLVLLEWLPDPGNPAQERQATLFSRGVDVRVASFLGLTRSQAAAGGVVSLVFGSGLGFFALLFRLQPAGSTLKTVKPGRKPAIEPDPGMRITVAENDLLGALFQKYARVSLAGEFLSGYSGARTFLALPVRPDGRSDATTIVKLGRRADIQREYNNYETYVRDSLPPLTARIQSPPVTLRGSERAALQYTFISEPGRLPVSLRLALRENPDPNLLDRLFNTFGPGWWMQRRPAVFRLGEEYDRLLPPHLVVQPIPPAGKALPVLDPARPAEDFSLEMGDAVIVARFPQFEKRLDGISMALTGTAASGRPPLRVRWLSNTPPDHSAGRVTGTRAGLLAEFCKDFERFGLPDPLEQLDERLNETVSGTRSIIHGDLNLENILVGPGGFVWLIDFSETRFGHPLFDFARLETEIIVQVLAARIGSGRIYLKHLESGDPLLGKVEEIAVQCLFNPAVRREYHLALYACCMGALKFTNLDRRQKHLLYLTAARLCLDF